MDKRYFIIPLLGLVLACKHKPVTNLHPNTRPKDTTATAPIPTSQLIVPGKSIGLTHINEPMDSVNVRLGKPDSGDAAMGAAMATWVSKQDSVPYQTDIYSHRNMGGKDENTGRVKIIRITSPAYKTTQNIHTGLTLRDIGRHFHVEPVGVYNKGTDSLKIYDDQKEGIAFEIDSYGKCKAILVHAEKDKSSGTLSFHPDMQMNTLKK
ncbi:hypothetical protein [Mucilaginibacter agri]|uniref:Lipoprotein n=1 Tax=Mucilaginibacter agri TaxID=2695265 RepID=A0A965ZCR1_9SPHI|nr:hypothetical protein [Mucilaginibacter agri]NCD68613.1 hypothetical protein [Mucilaginibacter agri]